MEVVTGATGSLLPKLGELLQEEYKLQTNVKKDVEYLQKELIFMRAALRKVAEVAPELLDEQVKAWSTNVKELSYDMVDTIDIFKVRVEASKAEDTNSLSVRAIQKIQRAKARHDLAEEITDMKSLTTELADLRDRYLLNDVLTKPVHEMNESRLYELWMWWTDRDIATTIDALQLRAQQINFRMMYQLRTWWKARDDIWKHIHDRKTYEQLWPWLGVHMNNLKEQVQQFSERQRRYAEEMLRSIEDDETSGNDALGFEAFFENQQTSRQLIGLKELVGVAGKDMAKLENWFQEKSKDQAGVADKDIKELENRSTDENKMDQAPILCIIGAQGVGKTTIAMALYRKFGGLFKCRAMITVSGSCNNQDKDTTQALFRSILDQVRPRPPTQKKGKPDHEPTKTICNKIMSRLLCSGTGPNTSGSHNGASGSSGKTDYHRQLKEHLTERSCLLFMDDVTDEKTLDTVRDSLPKGSKIIVTTRFASVAATCKKEWGDDIHNAGCLGGNKSKELFMEALSESKIRREDFEGKRMRNVPTRIWGICGGQPLAIVTMAGYVACNPDRSVVAWKQVCSQLVPNPTKVLNHESFPRMLSYCYNDMPAEIKTCSLYLTMYPRGCKISKKHMTRRWLAEGFVSEKPGQSAEDVAESYFRELMARRIVEPVECSSSGNVKSCQVYEIVHDYLLSKASEENFATVVGGSHYCPVPAAGGKFRRLSLQNSDFGQSVKNVVDTMNLSHVRSLTISVSSSSTPNSPNPQMAKLLNSSNFPLLQVLDLKGCSDFKDSKGVCTLLLLRYLGLRGTGITTLHEKIEKLKHLETLDIRETDITELPQTVCNLDGLVNILGGNKRTRTALKVPKGMEEMLALRVLLGMEIEQADNQNGELHQLPPQLRKLAIYSIKDKIRSSILFGSYLRSLVIYDESFQCLDSLNGLPSPPKSLTALELYCNKLETLPKWITELRALIKLTLPVTTLKEDALRDLSKLRVLFSLTFSLTEPEKDPEFPSEKQDEGITAILEKNKDTDGDILVPAGGFQNLKLLRFSAPMVPLLNFAEKAMPNLEKLEVRSSLLEGIYGIENLKRLKEVHIRLHDKADDFTMSIVQGIQAATRTSKVIVDRYHD